MAIKDELLGKPMLERIDFIKNSLINSPDFINEIHIFSGEVNHTKIKVFMVDIDFPIYRLKNIRTKGPQQSYIATNDIEDDFFSRDGESREALSIQHELLLEIAVSDKQTSASHVATFEAGNYDLAFPMIISSSGVLINGNTRMSALRSLFNSDPINYTRYSKIPMAILPSSFTERDFRKLELNLQINPDLRKEYSWISEAHDCREQILAGVHIDLLAAEYQRKSNHLAHPKNLLSQLNMADEYFKLNKETINYSYFEMSQYALWEWSKWRSTLGNELEHQYYVDILCSDLIKKKPKGTGILYIYIQQMAKSHRLNPKLYTESINQLSVDLASNVKTEDNDGALIITNESPILITDELAADLNNQEASESPIEPLVNLDVADDDEYDFLNSFDKDEISDKEEMPISQVISQIKESREKGIEIDIIKAVENTVSNMNEEDKRSKDLNLIYRDAIEIKEKAIDCFKRFETSEHKFENLTEAIIELKAAEIKIKALYELIENTNHES